MNKPKPKATEGGSSEGQKGDTGAADAKARRQAKLDEAERRDQERRRRAAEGVEGSTKASKVDDAPKAVPEEAVEEVPVVYDQTGGSAADPVPEAESMDAGSAKEAEETVMHEEL